MTDSVPIDEGTGVFLDALKELLVNEPERPDLDKHTGHWLQEVARRHDEWERQCDACRLLVGVRLTNAALGA